MGLFGAASQLRISQAGYVRLGLAALARALDRFMSAATSWMRYVTTATAIQTAVEKFQLDWDKSTASLARKTPSGQDLLDLINRITQFSGTVRALVENETNAWVAEFQANLAELQKTTAAAETAQQKAEAERQAARQKAEAEQAAKPGGIDFSIDNAAETDEGYDVLVDRQSKKTHVVSNSCGLSGIAPGLHELGVQA
jgi:hypothetical protein